MERISGRQLSLIGAAFVLDATLISLPNQIIGTALMDAWLSYIIAGSVILFSIWLLSKVMNRFPKQDLFEAMISRFPIMGRAISSLYVLFFFFILTRDLRMVTDFINLSLLTRTPIIILAIFVVITVVLIARGGIEILARMTELWFPVLIIVIVLMFFIIFRAFEYRFLQPFMGNGLLPSFRGSWYAVAYIGEVIAMPFLFSNQTFHFKHGIKAIFIGLFILMLLNFYTILTLGVHIPQISLYPFYEMVRHLRVTDFLDRFDLPVIGIWLPTMLTKIAYSLYFVCHGIKRILPNASAKVITTPMGVLGFVCSFWFYESAIQVFNFNHTWPACALIFELFIPIFLFVFLRSKNRKKTF